MAFEIYNGIGDEPNSIIDKAIEMWGFDSSDTESSYHSATYGNVKIAKTNTNSLALYVDATHQVYDDLTAGAHWTIVKSDSALLISFEKSTNSFATIVVGTCTGSDGVQGKGGIYVTSANEAATYIGTDDWSSGHSPADNTALRVSTELNQLVQVAAPQGKYYFNNAYRMILGISGTYRGLYTIGDDRYYISQRTAIKEE